MPYLISSRSEQSVKVKSKFIFSQLYMQTVYPGLIWQPAARKTPRLQENRLNQQAWS